MKNAKSIEKEQAIAMFSDFLNYYTSQVYVKGYDKEDLMQEGYLILYKAYEKYDETINDNFYFYGRKAIKNRFIELMRKMTVMNYELSIDSRNESCRKILYERSLDYNLEEDAINAMDEECLKNAIKKLPKYKQELIHSIYWDRMKITKYSACIEMPYRDCLKLHREIVEDLKTKPLYTLSITV